MIGKLLPDFFPTLDFTKILAKFVAHRNDLEINLHHCETYSKVASNEIYIFLKGKRYTLLFVLTVLPLEIYEFCFLKF